MYVLYIDFLHTYAYCVQSIQSAIKNELNRYLNLEQWNIDLYKSLNSAALQSHAHAQPHNKQPLPIIALSMVPAVHTKKALVVKQLIIISLSPTGDAGTKNTPLSTSV